MAALGTAGALTRERERERGGGRERPAAENVTVDAPAARERWTGLRPGSVNPSGMNGLRPSP